MSTDKLTFELQDGASPNEHIYRLKGPMVLDNMLALHETLQAETVATILDMTEVSYVDSAGLGKLATSYITHQKHGRKLYLVGLNGRVKELLQVTRLDLLLEVFPSVKEARSAYLLWRTGRIGA
jgi:anti-anti-sigma factor